MDVYIAGMSNVITYHNLLNLGSIPEVSVIYLALKANVRICFDYASISTSRLLFNFYLKIVNTVIVIYVIMNTLTLLAGLVTALSKMILLLQA